MTIQCAPILPKKLRIRSYKLFYAPQSGCRSVYPVCLNQILWTYMYLKNQIKFDNDMRKWAETSAVFHGHIQFLQVVL